MGVGFPWFLWRYVSTAELFWGSHQHGKRKSDNTEIHRDGFARPLPPIQSMTLPNKIGSRKVFRKACLSIRVIRVLRHRVEGTVPRL